MPASAGSGSRSGTRPRIVAASGVAVARTLMAKKPVESQNLQMALSSNRGRAIPLRPTGGRSRPWPRLLPAQNRQDPTCCCGDVLRSRGLCAATSAQSLRARAWTGACFILFIACGHRAGEFERTGPPVADASSRSSPCATGRSRCAARPLGQASALSADRTALLPASIARLWPETSQQDDPVAWVRVGPHAPGGRCQDGASSRT